MRLWDVNGDRSVQVLHGHIAWIWLVSFNPDGLTLASSSFDETIKLRDVSRGECLKRLRSDRLYEGMNITGVKGLTAVTITTLKALGAIEQSVVSEVGV